MQTLLDEQTLRTLPGQLFSYLAPSENEGEPSGLSESNSPFASRLHAAVAMLRDDDGTVAVGAAIETVPLPLAIPLSQLNLARESDDEPPTLQEALPQQQEHSLSIRHLLPAAQTMRDVIRAFELSETDLAWIAPSIVKQLGHAGDRLLHPPSRTASSLPSLVVCCSAAAFGYLLCASDQSE